jgi:apolipoprotein N-acyltransferase
VTAARARRGWWIDAAVAVGGGAAWAACFEATDHALLSWVALAPLCWLLGRPRAPLLALLHGATSWTVAIPWIVPTEVTYGDLPVAIAIVLFVLLAIYLGAYHAAFAWLGRRWWRRGGAAALAVLPALWCVLEVVRSWLFSGFPWNLAGYAWIGVPGALAITSWIGAYGLSALVVLANAGVALAIERRRLEPALWATLAALAALAIGVRFAAPPVSAGPTLPVRILQPSTPILSGDQRDEIARALERMFRMTREACDVEGALVVWPESAGWPYLIERDAAFRAEVEAAAARGCAILLNSPRFDGDRVYNAAFLIEPDGQSTHYDKRHLVPFGEYVPLAQALPFVSTLARNAGTFSASDRLSLLPWREATLGLAICFEVTFPAEVAELARSGADAFVTVTNDAWYGDSSAPWQHLRAARFRAAENHRTVVRAALTGVSAWIEPDGGMKSVIGIGERGILRGELEPRSQLTAYGRRPWTVPVACLAVCVAAWASASLSSRHGTSGARPTRSTTRRPPGVSLRPPE